MATDQDHLQMQEIGSMYPFSSFLPTQATKEGNAMYPFSSLLPTQATKQGNADLQIHQWVPGI